MCKFHTTKTLFLCNVIDQEGISRDQNKVHAVMKCPTPQNVKDLQRFIGFAHFYRRFIRGFSNVAAPLTALLKAKTKKLAWSEAKMAFQQLKQAFTTAPILHHPYLERHFRWTHLNLELGLYYHSILGNLQNYFPCPQLKETIYRVHR